MMGYAGLRYDKTSLLFNPIPGVLTPSTKSIRLRNLLVRGTYPFNYTIDQTSMMFQTIDMYSNRICIRDRHGSKWNITINPLQLYFQNTHLPIRVDLCD